MTSDLETIARIADGLSAEEQADIVKIGDPANPFGGLFDALSPARLRLFRGLGLVRCYIPAGCLAPLTKLTPRGRKLRDHIARAKL